LRTFLLNFDCASELEESDIERWIKRFDRDNDRGINFADLINAMQVMTNYQIKEEPK
jgi:Ca2+-binding EF-hand superfamily protein